MGWTIDDLSDTEHEGYVRAVELQHGSTYQWRDIDLGTDEWRARAAKGITVNHVQVVCTCGWRSERFHAPAGTDWMPSIVCFPDYMGDGSFWDDVCWDIWLAEHGRPMAALARDDVLVPRSLIRTARQYGRRPSTLSLLGE